MTELESRLDGLALLGFDAYMQRREKLCEVKVSEVQAQSQYPIAPARNGG